MAIPAPKLKLHPELVHEMFQKNAMLVEAAVNDIIEPKIGDEVLVDYSAEASMQLTCTIVSRPEAIGQYNGWDSNYICDLMHEETGIEFADVHIMGVYGDMDDDSDEMEWMIVDEIESRKIAGMIWNKIEHQLIGTHNVPDDYDTYDEINKQVLKDLQELDRWND